MILILKANIETGSDDYKRLQKILSSLANVDTSTHQVVGAQQTLTEIYLIGDTQSLDVEDMLQLPCVERVIRISEEYRILGRHQDDERSIDFEHNGIRFSQHTLNIFAGLCAVDTPEHVDIMLQHLQDLGEKCARMGAFKPRTNPYSFQGRGADCLPYVFELAGKHDIRVIAMEVTHESHVEAINHALQQSGDATAVLLQIGTRNTQNFELLKCIGRQQQHPVLLKRGFGITLEESLNAAEYLASEGNSRVIFGLRGMKTNMGDPHRNFVDFAHVPIVKRLTRMPVCIDPSHSVGSRDHAPDQILDVLHITAQGIIAGANMVLADFHPQPSKALVDGPQALKLNELEYFLKDIQLVREAYLQRVELKKKYS